MSGQVEERMNDYGASSLRGKVEEVAIAGRNQPFRLPGLRHATILSPLASTDGSLNTDERTIFKAYLLEAWGITQNHGPNFAIW